MAPPNGAHPNAGTSPLFVPNNRRPPARPGSASVTGAAREYQPVREQPKQPTAPAQSASPVHSPNPLFSRASHPSYPAAAIRDNSSEPLRPKVDAAVKTFFGLTEELREQALARTAFSFDHLDQDVASELSAKFAESFKQKAVEQQRVIEAGYARITTTLQEVLEGYASRAIGSPLQDLTTKVESLTRELASVKSGAPLSTPLSASPSTDTTLGQRLATLEGDFKRLERELGEARQSHASAQAASESSRKSLEARIAALEKQATQTIDPRRRASSALSTGSASNSAAPASPTLAAAAPPSIAPTTATRDELDALRGDVAKLASRIDADSTVLGKRPAADSLAGAQAKAQKTDERLESLEAKAAQAGKKIDAIEERVGALEGETAKSGCAAAPQSKKGDDDDMDLGTQSETSGMDLLEKRVEAIRSQWEQELSPVKQSLGQVSEKLAAVDGKVDSALQKSASLEDKSIATNAKLVALDSKMSDSTRAVSSVTSNLNTLSADFLALKQRSSSPATASPVQLEALRREIEDVKTRPSLSPSHVPLLDELATFVSNGDAALNPIALGTRLSLRLRGWDAGQASLEERVRKLREDIEEHSTKTGERFSALGDLALFLEEFVRARRILPQVAEMTAVMKSWEARKILPDEAWELPDDDESEKAGGEPDLRAGGGSSTSAVGGSGGETSMNNDAALSVAGTNGFNAPQQVQTPQQQQLAGSNGSQQQQQQQQHLHVQKSPSTAQQALATRIDPSTYGIGS
ncbi:hypothetical protein Rhopal_000611-T1 [Rhodotorula paludigena]|uniref:Uncharacterized protein n=1 Tax=Rhodotorula paludigena TaxID=86838 RepID=A0AAV5GDI0_9BASI|nr:hypothetical protein Rhopal_000611-T1 [Rhodotorula paludigena]